MPAGHRRIYLSAGPFTTITGDDAGTALLNFTAAGAQGAYTMTFWAGVTGEENDPELYFSKPLTVTPPPPANTVFADGFSAGTVERWSHRVGGDASTVAYLRLDGDAHDESSFGNHGTAIGTNEGEVEIGSYEDARFRGAIDEVLIMNRALSFREVGMLLP